MADDDDRKEKDPQGLTKRLSESHSATEDRAKDRRQGDAKPWKDDD
jgi:hypothetical protein